MNYGQQRKLHSSGGGRKLVSSCSSPNIGLDSTEICSAFDHNFMIKSLIGYSFHLMEVEASPATISVVGETLTDPRNIINL
jgi:hypothetical protein